MLKPTAKPPKKNPIEKLLKLREKLGVLAVLDETAALSIAVKLYWIAMHLRTDVDDWQMFCEHPDWIAASPKPQPKTESREKALQFAIKFAVGFKKEANSNRVRKFHDILKGAWDTNKASKEIEAYVKKILAEKRKKAAETRVKRRATTIRSIKLIPSDASQLVVNKGENLVLKGEFAISNAGGPAMSLEITRLSEKSLKKLGVTKPSTVKSAGK